MKFMSEEFSEINPYPSFRANYCLCAPAKAGAVTKASL